MADGSINIDLLLNDQTDKTWTDFKQKAEQTGKDGYQKFKDAFKGDPLVAKLEAQANKAGISNFRELLNKLPKEKQTELLAKAKKGEVVDYEKLLREIPSKITSEVKLNDNASTGLRSLKNQAHDVGDKFKRLKDVMIGTFAAQALMGGIRAVVDGLKEASKAGMEYNKEQDTMRTVWSALTTEAPKDGKELLNYINSLSQHSIYAADDINKMAQSFYHVHSNVEETKKWTDSFVALGSTLHMTGPQISESGEMFAKIVAGGKASSEDMAVMINRFPMFGEALQKATGKSMKELYAMSAAGKLSAEQFTQALDYLGEKYKGGTAEAMTSMQGMSMYLHSRLQVLSGDVMKSSFNMSKSATEALQKITSDDSMKKFAESISGAISVALVGISKLLTYISNHSKDIIGIIGNVKEFVGLLIGGAWEMFKDTLTGIGKAFGIVSGNSKSAQDPLKTINSILGEIVKHKSTIKALGAAILAAFAVKKLSDFVNGITTVIKTLKLATAAQWLLNTAMKANPIGIIITILVALGVAFYELYKHNKKFKSFIDGLVKGAKDFFTGIGKWFGQAGKAIGKFFSGLGKWGGNVLKSMGKIWDPIQKTWTKSWNAISSLFSKVLNGIKKIFTNAVNNIKKVLTVGLKVISKVWSTTWNAISNVFSKIWKGLIKILEHAFNFYKNIFIATLNFITKLWGKSWDFVSDVFEKIWNGIKKFFKPIIEWLSDIISDTVNGIKNVWNKVWNSISGFFTKTWWKLQKIGNDGISLIHDTLSGVLDKIGKTFSDTWDGIKNGFGKMWDGMKKLAGDGINAVISIPNTGIDGINGLIHDFGGPKEALGHIPKVKFASGTGVFNNARRSITSPTMAILNDGTDSPATGNKEALIHPNGAMEVVQGTNTERLLMPGTEVLNASELAMIMGHEHFATGTGWLGSIWNGIKGAGSWVGKTAGNAWNGMKDGVDKFTKMLGFITDAVAHPVETMKKTFNPEAKGMGNMFNGLGGGLFGKVKNQAKDWWSSLWSMANDSSNDGASAGNKGDDYPWKSVGKDSGADPWGYFYRECVSFVASRLKNMGVAPGLFSGLGNGADWVNAPVGHSNNPKPGSVAVYGPGSEFGNHVAMVTGVQGGSFSGEEYNWNGDGNYHTYQGRSKKGATTFLDFGVGSPSGENKTSDDKGGPLQGLIKGQVGGMFDWIKKFISPLTGGNSAGGGDVQSWSGDVKKALGVLGLSTSGSMVQKILKQIQTESGGNAKAIGGNDGLADGNATGLMQVKPGTFNAYKQPGHDNIMNGYDNILAGLAYAKDRYGSDLSFLGQGHGYENGGWANKPSIFGEINGQPEIAINPARSSADQHISEAIIARANKAPNSLSAKLAQVVKGAKSGMQSIVAQQPAIAGHGGQFNSNSGIDLSGDVHMVITMDSGEVARATYPKIQVLQNQEIQMKGQRTGNTYAY